MRLETMAALLGHRSMDVTRPQSSLARANEVGEGSNCGAEPFGHGLHPPVPTPSGKASFLVEAKSQVFIEETLI